MSALFEIVRGDAPLIVSVPHCGTRIPGPIAARLSDAALAVPDTDWHVEKLYGFAPARGVTLITATHSRYVVDLNRDPDGVPLYPGADNTELCPTRTFLGDPVYRDGAAPSADEVAERRQRYWQPWHAALAVEIERVRAQCGYAVLLDGHSIFSEVPRFFAGRLPDLNLGTADGRSTGPVFAQRARAVLGEASGFSHVVNGRFKGGYITRHYGEPARAIHALQLEMAEACYMDERPPYRWDPARAAPLVAVLERLVDALRAPSGPA